MPVKLLVGDACPACDVDSQVWMHNRSSNQAISLFSQTVYCWGSQCFLMLSWRNLDMCDLDFFLETSNQVIEFPFFGKCVYQKLLETDSYIVMDPEDSILRCVAK